MISQYGLSMSLIVPRYTKRWSDYILQQDPSEPVYRDELKDDDMLHIHRFGLYEVSKAEDMYALSSLFAAVLLHDRRVSGHSQVLSERMGKLSV